jgi:hypothetical protein
VGAQQRHVQPHAGKEDLEFTTEGEHPGRAAAMFQGVAIPGLAAAPPGPGRRRRIDPFVWRKIFGRLFFASRSRRGGGQGDDDASARGGACGH